MKSPTNTHLPPDTTKKPLLEGCWKRSCRQGCPEMTCPGPGFVLNHKFLEHRSVTRGSSASRSFIRSRASFFHESLGVQLLTKQTFTLGKVTLRSLCSPVMEPTPCACSTLGARGGRCCTQQGQGPLLYIRVAVSIRDATARKKTMQQTKCSAGLCWKNPFPF